MNTLTPGFPRAFFISKPRGHCMVAVPGGYQEHGFVLG